MNSPFRFTLFLLCAFFLTSCDSDSNGEMCITVTPSESYILSGTAMTADFTPASKTYTVNNTCDSDITLNVIEFVRWLDVDIEAFGGGSNESGTLDANSSVEVTIGVRYGTDNPERLDQLAPGGYQAELRFEDDTNNNTTLRLVELTVN